MKHKGYLIAALVCVIVISVVYENSQAGFSASGKSDTGIVNIRKVFKNCQRNEQYRQRVQTEQDKVRAELEKLRAEVEAAKAGLNTLKQGSIEYMERARDVLTKEANLQAQQEFYKRHLEAKDQRWTEDLYKDLLASVKNVASARGLNIVLADEDVEFPMETPNDLMMSIRTNKVLYSEGCVDISDEVLEQLDSMKK